MSKVYYAISITPIGSLPSEAGYNYMAAKWTWNEKKSKLVYLQASEFFKTQEEVSQFKEQHPEYRWITEIVNEVRK